MATWEYEYSVVTSAAPEAVWRHWSDMAAWPAWNAGIESIEIDGPFRPGTTFTMTPPGEDPVRMTLTEVVPGELFTDVAGGGDFAVTTVHRLEPATDGGTRIVYRTEITGEAAASIGPEIGPMITADFPDVLAALAARAERDDT
jgi:uncharacterized protein YndB with AHSA1/START domain